MTSDHAQPFVAPGPIRRVALIVGDILETVAIVLCVPFVIVAIGMPFVLCARFLLWIVGML